MTNDSSLERNIVFLKLRLFIIRRLLPSGGGRLLGRRRAWGHGAPLLRRRRGLLRIFSTRGSSRPGRAITARHELEVVHDDRMLASLAAALLVFP